MKKEKGMASEKKIMSHENKKKALDQIKKRKKNIRSIEDTPEVEGLRENQSRIYL